MDKSSTALFCLLQSSLHSCFCGEAVVLLTENEWRSLINLSFDQGVAAIAADGLQRFYDANPNVSLEIDKEEQEDLKYEWFGEVLQSEK